ncbi:hypothetical protein PPL_09263 [Heterostelium album PN500]|uniref:Uncharacterized protein n=1 Tax=Heterostelium pallidum (strain ATCC 26659 / Pp 5 / PN500) TaxID=670386 RepID=D3BL31_HETP5|nr:hypothetical protein PPL_09263 [Heterostelium album PN500]EFA77765.1 hypothetical protein PPL_09263 [Heterostelium album PN500]|eukprot:XP_020429893.1 hypothetical protein PPL_09263 [Heterostelium album PN500]
MEDILSCFDSYNELEKQWITYRDKGTKLANTLEVIKDKLQQKQESLSTLESRYSKNSNSSSNNNNMILRLINYFKDIVDMYVSSLANKKTILDTLLSCNDRDQLITYVSAWQNDIHINRDTIETIQDMLTTHVSINI